MSAHIFFCFSLACLSGVFGTEFVPVQEGESVTLPVNLTEHQRKQGISWKFGAQGFLIAEVIKGNGKLKIYEDQADGRFRDRLTLDHTGSLTITNITANDTNGLYEVINTSNNTKLNTFNITVYAPGSVPVISDWSFTFIHLVVMCCAAAAAGSVTSALLIFCICRKHTNTQQQVVEADQTREPKSDVTYTEPTFCKRPRSSVNDDMVYSEVMIR